MMLQNIDRHNGSTQPKAEFLLFIFSGRRVEVWGTIFAYALSVPDNVYLISSQSQFTELKYLAPIEGYWCTDIPNTGYVNSNHHAAIYGHSTTRYISHCTHSTK